MKRTRTAPDDGEQGVVLILAILLLAVVVVLTVHAQISVSLALRRARARATTSTLQIAASDAMRHFLDEAAGPSFPGTDRPLASASVLPSGVEIGIAVSPATNMNSAVMPFLKGGHQNEELFLVDSIAALSNTAERVTCIVRKDAGGNLRVAGWLRD